MAPETRKYHTFGLRESTVRAQAEAGDIFLLCVSWLPPLPPPMKQEAGESDRVSEASFEEDTREKTVRHLAVW